MCLLAPCFFSSTFLCWTLWWREGTLASSRVKKKKEVWREKKMKGERKREEVKHDKFPEARNMRALACVCAKRRKTKKFRVYGSKALWRMRSQLQYKHSRINNNCFLYNENWSNIRIIIYILNISYEHYKCYEHIYIYFQHIYRLLMSELCVTCLCMIHSDSD